MSIIVYVKEICQIETEYFIRHCQRKLLKCSKYYSVTMLIYLVVSLILCMPNDEAKIYKTVILDQILKGEINIQH